MDQDKVRGAHDDLLNFGLDLSCVLTGRRLLVLGEGDAVVFSTADSLNQ